MGIVKKPVGKSETPDQDELHGMATRAAADAIGVLLEANGIERPIKTISRLELDMMAVACITAWVVTRAEQARLYDLGDIRKELLNDG